MEEKKQNRKRNKQLKFFVDENELEKIEKKIEKSKLTKSDYLRKCSLEKEIFVIEGLKELALEVSRIGNNINQLTKTVHQGLISDTGELKKLELEYKKVFKKILEISKG